MEPNINGVGPIAQAVIARDHDALATSYHREYPLVVDHALGSEVWDVDGRRYIDFMAGVAVLNVGHRHPKVVEAVRQQVDKFWHICLHDFYYPNAVDLAEQLQRIAPMSDHTRIYFGNSGTEAVEAAIKLARYKTKRSRFIGFTGAFHGRTLGSLSFTSSKTVQRANYQLMVPVHHLPYPNEYRPVLVSHNGEHYGDTILDYLENELFRMVVSPQDIAGILIEPIQGEGGYVIPTPGFFPRLRQLCDRHGILLMVDEVQSGAGRTGRWWAIEHEDVEPDIVCFAKGVASGMPLGGIIARDEVMAWKSGAHGSTFGGNPVAVAASAATLQVIEEEGLLERATESGNYILDALAEMETKHPSIGQVRGRGLMVGIEFVTDRETKKRGAQLRNHVVQRGFAEGLLLLPCGENTIRLTPPLNIPRHLLDEGLQIFEHVVGEAEAMYL
ncbi:MAG: acetyl ornithine aminotransferase family protein [Anaerolineales bacterium]|nr:acetyl ornithine aminotransferase family protein [Anaerolineales bacterium]MCB8950924.1 acetyl ornithine aminotransferase family protein [Ardenticatenales bacterium]